MQPLIEDNALVLFQGDSITDSGWDRNNDAWLGIGYVQIAASQFSALYPEKRVRFLNRGISGHRAKDLRDRWQKDCIDLRPDWVSIMIGINDVWRRYDSNDPTACQAYEDNYRFLLTEVRDKLGAKLIILEPFLLPTPPDRAAWREDLDPKIHVARRLARQFGAIFVPLDGLFAAAATKREPEFWAGDGVHPSMPGHALIADAWLKAVKAIG